MDLKTKIVKAIIECEKGYVVDSGGPTRYGITEKTARRIGYTGDMKQLPRSIAFVFYSGETWNMVRGDDLIKLSYDITHMMMDTSVNQGPKYAADMLQRALNVLNKGPGGVLLYEILDVDGVIGSKTIHAMDCYLKMRSDAILFKIIGSFRCMRYVELAECQPNHKTNIYGWIKNRAFL